MTFGPYGVGRIDGKTVMVPNAVPGDVLAIAVESERHDYTRGRITRVVTPGAARRTPPCPFVPRCGGCDWQQIDYPAQVRIKADLIAAEFRRSLGLELDASDLVEAAPAEFGYRSRIRLKTGAGGALGFHELGTNLLVPVDHCIVAAPGLELPVELARALGRRCIEVEAVVAGEGEAGEVLVAHLAQAPGADEVARTRRVFESHGGIRGIVLSGGGEREVVGDATVRVELEAGLVLLADADQFSQVNREQNRKLVAAVMEMAAIGEHVSVLDLFCGAGNFSLPAARRGARVTGVDSDALAVATAARNAARMGFDDARFLAMKAAETARFLERARYRPDTVIVDPPRTGALDLMEAMVRLRPPHLIYVSCDTSTLVRDLQILVANHYQIKRVRAFDFFPNTHHAELVVHALLT
ncbi:MAG: class I SAM-dependent RNA methyltransferase [Candidatus Binataceae bacterium]